MKKKVEPAILSLHTHWITADAVKERIFIDVPGAEGQIPKELEPIAQRHSQTQTLVVFYALLYVVAEGYRELKLKDNVLDALLAKDKYLDQLRRFRNAIFHYHRDPFDKRLVEFLSSKQSEKWTKKLHSEFGNFFVRTLPIKEALARLKEFDAKAIEKMVARKKEKSFRTLIGQ